ncbi:hypothetical protein MTO96_013621 [Rhipicephalus appendiculatus]
MERVPRRQEGAGADSAALRPARLQVAAPASPEAARNVFSSSPPHGSESDDPPPQNKPDSRVYGDMRTQFVTTSTPGTKVNAYGERCALL